MKLSILALCAGSASAFAPIGSQSRASVSLNVAAELDGMIGVGPETGNKIFDPLDLSDYIPMKYAREAELANGRSAMLATVGWVFPKFVGTFASDDVTSVQPVDAIMQADPQWWAQFIFMCGAAEAYKYRATLRGESFCGPGKPMLDYMNLYPDDPAAREVLHLKELKNGRLAMIAMAAYFSAEFIPGSVPGLPESLL